MIEQNKISNVMNVNKSNTLNRKSPYLELSNVKELYQENIISTKEHKTETSVLIYPLK